MVGIRFRGNENSNKPSQGLSAKKKALKESNEGASGVLTRFIADPLRNAFNTSGSRKRAESEFKKLEQSFNNKEKALKTKNGDFIKFTEKAYKKQEDSFNKAIENRNAGNQVWGESIAHSIALVAGAETAAARNVPLLKGVAIAGVVGGLTKTALMLLNNETTKKHKPYTKENAVKDMLTGGYDTSIGYVGGVMGGRAFNAMKKFGRLPAITTDIAIQGTTGFTAGSTVDILYQKLDDEKKIDKERVIDAGKTTAYIFMASSILGHALKGRFLPGHEFNLEKKVQAGPVSPCSTPSNSLKRLSKELDRFKKPPQSHLELPREHVEIPREHFEVPREHFEAPRGHVELEGHFVESPEPRRNFFKINKIDDESAN